jgi:hypothetical protein
VVNRAGEGGLRKSEEQIEVHIRHKVGCGRGLYFSGNTGKMIPRQMGIFICSDA